MRRGWKILIIVVVALGLLLALNAVALDRQTRPAERTVEGARIMELPGGDLQVLDSGRPQGPPIVLLHCFTCSINWWQRLTPLLERSHRVIAIDLLGHGGSEKPGSGYSMPAQAELVAQALGRLGVTNATVVGHSLGAKVATALAEQSKQLVGGLVVIDSAADTSYGSLDLLARAGFVPVIGEALWRVKVDYTIREGLKQVFASGFEIPDVFVEDLRRMTYTSFDKSPSAHDDYVEQEPMDDRIRATSLPLLVIYGAEDETADDPREALSAFADVPGAQTALIQGAGHSPNVEKPAQTASLIRRFLRETASRPPRRRNSSVDRTGPRTIVASCRDAQIGPGDPRWRKRSTVAEPLGFYGPGRDFRRAQRTAGVLVAKVPLFVAGTKPVVLRVPPSQRGRIGFLYGPVRAVDSLATAPRQMRFAPCRDQPRTAWPGGLALKNRRPVTLEVVTAAGHKRIRVG